MSEGRYSQGVCEDGAAILHDGQPITVDEIVRRLNHYTALEDAARLYASVSDYASAEEAEAKRAPLLALLGKESEDGI